MRFSTVVGHEQLKTALLLAAIDPHIGGVLLRGDKGSGKTTVARALADLLPGDAPFVELPLGATEDRVLGSIDIGAALTTGTEQVRSGLFAAAHGGVLFVDEVNLLADHLVDTLLDVATSGSHRLERDGISVVQPARFVLIGTMNPEEGELRPQLLDRFGLCVDVVAPVDPNERAEIVRRRLNTDAEDDDAADAAEADAADQAIRRRLETVKPAALDDPELLYASHLALEVGVEGLRSDLVLCRAAAAFAGWDGRTRTIRQDIEAVAPLVLAHRRRRGPFDPPQIDPDELEDAMNRARGQTSDEQEPHDNGRSDPESDPESDLGQDPEPGGEGGEPGKGDDRPVQMGEQRRPPRPTPVSGRRPGPSGRGSPAPSARGRIVRERPHDPASGNPVDVVASVRSLAGRRVSEPDAQVSPGDLREVERADRTGSLVVICLDTSGSMGVQARIELATGTAVGVLTEAYQQRDRVAVVTFGGDGARTVLSPTTSIEVARTRLADLTTGGRTPLADGLSRALQLAIRSAKPGEPVHLVVITDGRATGTADAFGDALAAAEEIRSAGVSSVVIDTEIGLPRLGLVDQLAEALGASVQHPEPQHTR